MIKQFDTTYTLTPRFEENPGNLKKQRFIEEEQIRVQSELTLRPSNIEYFEKLMYSGDFRKKDRPRVGCFCNMIPQELIWALGAEPVRLDCGNSAAALLGEEMLSGEICPLAKASFGIFLREDSLANTCNVLILPTSCDAKRKMGEILNDFKPTSMFNMPPEQNHSRFAKQSYLEILRLKEFLEKHLKTRLSGRALREAVKLGQRRTQIVRELQKLRIEKPGSLSLRDFFLMIQSSLFRPVDLQEWLEETMKVKEQIISYEPERKSLRPLLILTGAPMVWPNYKVLNILEESGADIVADTLCTGAQSCFDPVVMDEHGKRPLLRALVNRYVFASVCPCFISQTTRINRILDLVDEGKADGVVNYSLRLCQLFDVESYRIERTLKAQKTPYMTIRTDYSLEDTEQLRIRIEAFLETLY
jgi:benzoyl-CoA reductase/2-hydroxyglutaryl-CoA dehydratase subunit BcrC/BadD/HgdB